MNDEIKGILKILKKCEFGACITKHNSRVLLDYITNLQQENKSLTEQLEYLRSGEYLNQVKWERDLNENLNQTMSIELIDYKSRCEKAIEYIKENNCPDPYCLTDDLLNILQNGSEENE